jgi:hypothetical protein
MFHTTVNNIRDVSREWNNELILLELSVLKCKPGQKYNRFSLNHKHTINDINKLKNYLHSKLKLEPTTLRGRETYFHNLIIEEYMDQEPKVYLRNLKGKVVDYVSKNSVFRFAFNEKIEIPPANIPCCNFHMFQQNLFVELYEHNDFTIEIINNEQIRLKCLFCPKMDSTIQFLIDLFN